MIAMGFARNGATVYIAARKEAQLKQAIEDIKEVATGKVDYIVANVGSKAGCDGLISEFKKRESKLHVLVNNSGITWGGPYSNFPEEKGWDNVFNVNVKSIFYMTAGLSDYLIKDSTSTDPGRVLNISSTAYASSAPGLTYTRLKTQTPSSVMHSSEGPLSDSGNGVWSYLPSKAAVNHLTSQLAVKLAPSFVTVNAILPGVYPSKMSAFGLKLRRQDSCWPAHGSSWIPSRYGWSRTVPRVARVRTHYWSTYYY
ncbi:hypothetical protein B0H14DRAFT_233524 [Mycena olivaceomarginata]|nr:hypothetical protein B0H14DRAFT_233524 [Mycena olivaceomarginata]